MSKVSRLPAMLGLGDAGQAAKLRRFGWELGVAFQMADDLIDLLTVLDDQHGGNRVDSEPAGGLGVVVGVELGDDPPAV